MHLQKIPIKLGIDIYVVFKICTDNLTKFSLVKWWQKSAFGHHLSLSDWTSFIFGTISSYGAIDLFSVFICNWIVTVVFVA